MNVAIEIHSIIRDLNSKNILKTYEVVKSKEEKIKKDFVICERVHSDLKSYIVRFNDTGSNEKLLFNSYCGDDGIKDPTKIFSTLIWFVF